MQDLQTKSQTFEALRTQNFMYVDKTKHIYELAKKEGAYFLSRPRRFGKSLLVSTFEALFKNKKELFKDLYIYDKWQWGTEYPVIKIDFSNINLSSLELFIKDLTQILEKIANHPDNNIDLGQASLAGKFTNLIEGLYEKKKQKVVILIDEYDMAITDNLSKSYEVQESIREFLRGFYKVLKGCDAYIKFIFLTGVTKFSGLSLFSGLNNLKDITLNPKFCDICGYTQEELENNFSEYIDEFAKENGDNDRQQTLKKIKHWYNGYTWDGKTAIYNPYSTLNLFTDKLFRNYWFDSGSPKFLIEYLQEQAIPTDMAFEDIKVIYEELMSGDEYGQGLQIPLLFQAGYLTIKKITHISLEDMDEDVIYTLGLPNLEVGKSLANIMLLPHLKKGSRLESVLSLKADFAKSIKNIDEKLFSKTLGDLLSHVPYQIAGKTESHYHSNILLALKMMGFNVVAEDPTDRGRIDIVWRYGNFIVLIEAKYTNKVNEIDTKMKQAFEQIDDRQYYRKFEHEGKQIILAGIVFANENVKQKDTKAAKVKFKVEFRVRDPQ